MAVIFSPEDLKVYDQLIRAGYSPNEAIRAVRHGVNPSAQGPKAEKSANLADAAVALGLVGGGVGAVMGGKRLYDYLIARGARPRDAAVAANANPGPGQPPPPPAAPPSPPPGPTSGPPSPQSPPPPAPEKPYPPQAPTDPATSRDPADVQGERAPDQAGFASDQGEPPRDRWDIYGNPLYPQDAYRNISAYRARLEVPGATPPDPWTYGRDDYNDTALDPSLRAVRADQSNQWPDPWYSAAQSADIAQNPAAEPVSAPIEANNFADPAYSAQNQPAVAPVAPDASVSGRQRNQSERLLAAQLLARKKRPTGLEFIDERGSTTNRDASYRKGHVLNFPGVRGAVRGAVEGNPSNQVIRQNLEGVYAAVEKRHGREVARGLRQYIESTRGFIRPEKVKDENVIQTPRNYMRTGSLKKLLDINAEPLTEEQRYGGRYVDPYDRRRNTRTFAGRGAGQDWLDAWYPQGSNEDLKQLELALGGEVFAEDANRTPGMQQEGLPWTRGSYRPGWLLNVPTRYVRQPVYKQIEGGISMRDGVPEILGYRWESAPRNFQAQSRDQAGNWTNVAHGLDSFALTTPSMPYLGRTAREVYNPSLNHNYSIKGVLSQNPYQLAELGSGSSRAAETLARAIRHGQLQKDQVAQYAVSLAREHNTDPLTVINGARRKLKELPAPGATQERTPLSPGSGRAVGSTLQSKPVPMTYAMPANLILPGLADIYPEGTTTYDLINNGLRTGTTRLPFAKPGQVIRFVGKDPSGKPIQGYKHYRVKAVIKPDLESEAGRANWELNEGWKLSAIEQDMTPEGQKLKAQIYDPRAVQTIFEPLRDYKDGPDRVVDVAAATPLVGEVALEKWLAGNRALAAESLLSHVPGMAAKFKGGKSQLGVNLSTAGLAVTGAVQDFHQILEAAVSTGALTREQAYDIPFKPFLEGYTRRLEVGERIKAASGANAEAPTIYVPRRATQEMVGRVMQQGGTVESLINHRVAKARSRSPFEAALSILAPVQRAEGGIDDPNTKGDRLAEWAFTEASLGAVEGTLAGKVRTELLNAPVALSFGTQVEDAGSTSFNTSAKKDAASTLAEANKIHHPYRPFRETRRDAALADLQLTMLKQIVSPTAADLQRMEVLTGRLEKLNADISMLNRGGIEEDRLGKPNKILVQKAQDVNEQMTAMREAGGGGTPEYKALGEKAQRIQGRINYVRDNLGLIETKAKLLNDRGQLVLSPTPAGPRASVVTRLPTVSLNQFEDNANTSGPALDKQAEFDRESALNNQTPERIGDAMEMASSADDEASRTFHDYTQPVSGPASEQDVSDLRARNIIKGFFQEQEPVAPRPQPTVQEARDMRLGDIIGGFFREHEDPVWEQPIPASATLAPNTGSRGPYRDMPSTVARPEASITPQERQDAAATNLMNFIAGQVKRSKPERTTLDLEDGRQIQGPTTWVPQDRGSNVRTFAEPSEALLNQIARMRRRR